MVKPKLDVKVKGIIIVKMNGIHHEKSNMGATKSVAFTFLKLWQFEVLYVILELFSTKSPYEISLECNTETTYFLMTTLAFSLMPLKRIGY